MRRQTRRAFPNSYARAASKSGNRKGSSSASVLKAGPRARRRKKRQSARGWSSLSLRTSAMRRVGSHIRSKPCARFVVMPRRAPGRPVPAGWTRAIRYRLARTATGSAPLPANAPSLISGMTLPEGIAGELMPLAAKALLPLYIANGRKMEGLLEALVAVRKNGLFALSGAVEDAPRYRLMTARLDRALALASGIRVKLTPRDEVLVPDSTTPFTLSISNTSNREEIINEIDFEDLKYESGIETPQRLAPGKTIEVAVSAHVPRDAALS